jgi:PhoH-like ATPase
MTPRKRKKKKIFILDTNVVLHDSNCIYQFEEHDIVLPITVLEELDAFKKGNDTINFHAREFVRNIDQISHESIFMDGIQIDKDLGKLTIRLEEEMHPDISLSFAEGKPDHYILNSAYWVKKENPDKEVILVTKDVNLRMKAKAVGLISEEYLNDMVKDLSSLYKGFRIVENTLPELIEMLYREPFEFPADKLKTDEPLVAHEHLIIRNGKKSALACYNPFNESIEHVVNHSAYEIKPRNAEQNFALNILLNDDIKLVSLSGKAGTGKTLLALASALEKRKKYRQVYMARPVVPLSNKDLGYLPGDIHSKLDPYMKPLFDNLGVIRNQFDESDLRNSQIGKWLEEEKLVISPLSYIRGRSLVKIFFIVDEAQNLTPHEVKTIITRAGEGTKIVFTGDIYQIDHPYLDAKSNGLSFLIQKMQGQKLYAHINLEKGERSELAELASNLL